ncbi:Mannose-6-phosphate isomerase ManA [Mesoplasma sp. JKS002660]|uniref:type I phosphomannose isomerase catalytic subunit n=1 Tax=Mesoplasma whartonense TaxID=2878854 RepID=UPI002022A56E|nr:type I phosphomannose isomerase catalytic subunit [Mesoplasma sp. JKS002660]MCL8213519.1 Mannose-6-phosphate isomerase ManA [Mesoplasma sp. JKS002660]
MKIIKLKPYFSEKIWGGQELNNFGYQIPQDKKIGEAWIISAHPNGMSYLDSPGIPHQSLKDFFDQNREEFGNYQGEFPLLVKIITANDFLSVQVHPDDQYAKKHHQSLGKPESWYVLAAPENAQLIYGHHAKTRLELVSMVKNNQWEKLLKKVQIEVGDFVYVDAGKIHAITPGVVVYELQRSSDITYRFYDFEREDEYGKKRSLNIKDSLQVTTVPDSKDQIIKKAEKLIWSSSAFSLYLADVEKKEVFKLSKTEQPYWLQFTVISGEGTIHQEPFKKGESAIGIGNLEDVELVGKMKVLISWIRK